MLVRQQGLQQLRQRLKNKKIKNISLGIEAILKMSLDDVRGMRKAR